MVTAAGISGEVDAVDYAPNDFRRLLDVNVMGTFLVVQAATKTMLQHGFGGSVVLVASMSGSVANKVGHSDTVSPFPFARIHILKCIETEDSKPIIAGSPYIGLQQLQSSRSATRPFTRFRMGNEPLKEPADSCQLYQPWLHPDTIDRSRSGKSRSQKDLAGW